MWRPRRRRRFRRSTARASPVWTGLAPRVDDSAADGRHRLGHAERRRHSSGPDHRRRRLGRVRLAGGAGAAVAVLRSRAASTAGFGFRRQWPGRRAPHVAAARRGVRRCRRELSCPPLRRPTKLRLVCTRLGAPGGRAKARRRQPRHRPRPHCGAGRRLPGRRRAATRAARVADGGGGAERAVDVRGGGERRSPASIRDRS